MDNEFIARKTGFLVKDYETAFSSYGRHSDKVASIRTWTITLLVAYLGFVATSGSNSPQVMVLPVAIIIACFFALEARERKYMRFLVQELRNVETIFMTKDNEEFHSMVEAYEFRNMRLADYRMNLNPINLLKPMRSKGVVLWYGFLIVTFMGLLYVVNNIG
jgi:uncharacterized membrane protein